VREVIVWPEVHNTLWQLLRKDTYDNVIERIYWHLENQFDHCREQRDPDDETLFDFVLYVPEQGIWHTFRFSVDDTMSADHLFVIDIGHESGKVGM
jgi:hypothetical protein